MLLVKTYLDKSKIHGIGLFSGQSIPKGKIVYKLSPKLDINLPAGKFNKLDCYSKKQIKHYGHVIKKGDRWCLAFDDIRFCNHNKNGNITTDKKSAKYQLIAKTDIKKGDEITQDYAEFENLRKVLKNKQG